MSGEKRSRQEGDERRLCLRREALGVAHNYDGNDHLEANGVVCQFGRECAPEM